MFIVRQRSCKQKISIDMSSTGALGARLFLPPQQSRKLGWVIWTGTDFPTSVEKLLNSWATTLFLRKVDKPSTRGELIYEDTTFGRMFFSCIYLLIFYICLEYLLTLFNSLISLFINL